tara:strand:+ start:1150 stop:1314 length:165 start_codon:yes stop_codon:yes gene_type:complete
MLKAVLILLIFILGIILGYRFYEDAEQKNKKSIFISLILLFFGSLALLIYLLYD